MLEWILQVIVFSLILLGKCFFVCLVLKSSLFPSIQTSFFAQLLHFVESFEGKKKYLYRRFNVKKKNCLKWFDLTAFSKLIDLQSVRFEVGGKVINYFWKNGGKLIQINVHNYLASFTLHPCFFACWRFHLNKTCLCKHNDESNFLQKEDIVKDEPNSFLVFNSFQMMMKFSCTIDKNNQWICHSFFTKVRASKIKIKPAE